MSSRSVEAGCRVLYTPFTYLLSSATAAVAVVVYVSGAAAIKPEAEMMVHDDYVDEAEAAEKACLQKLDDILSERPPGGRRRNDGPAEIVEHVYLGSMVDALDTHLLRRLRITHVLNCAPSAVRRYADSLRVDVDRCPSTTSPGSDAAVRGPDQRACTSITLASSSSLSTLSSLCGFRAKFHETSSSRQHIGIPYPISENSTTSIDLAVNVIVMMHDIRRCVALIFFSPNKRKLSEMKNNEVD